ncbi:hypothetical protein ABZ348_28865 [Streptomyces sp. NPDC005963]|uniref:hypothetical protein n=1 Tax=Streptomyces sp. NPDC005963 TaxID=3156721 RepID=UPI0033D82E09
MTLRRANIVITAVCALAGAGMLAGRVWAQGPEPLDLGPAIVVQPSGLPMPEATARSQPPSPMSPSLPERNPPPPTKSAPVPQTSTPTPRFTSPSPQQSGGRPVEILEPPRSSESGTPRPGGQEEEGDDEEDDEDEAADAAEAAGDKGEGDDGEDWRGGGSGFSEDRDAEGDD